MVLKYSEVFGGFSKSSNGDWIQSQHTLTLLEVNNKEFVMTPPALIPSEVVVDIVGGSPQEVGIDFQILGDKFQWEGLGLDGTLSVGDIIRLAYFG